MGGSAGDADPESDPEPACSSSSNGVESNSVDDAWPGNQAELGVVVVRKWVEPGVGGFVRWSDAEIELMRFNVIKSSRSAKALCNLHSGCSCWIGARQKKIEGAAVDPLRWALRGEPLTAQEHQDNARTEECSWWVNVRV